MCGGRLLFVRDKVLRIIVFGINGWYDLQWEGAEGAYVGLRYLCNLGLSKPGLRGCSHLKLNFDFFISILSSY